MENKKIKILFFIGSLSAGGKERRLLELLTYLGNLKRFQLFLVTKKTEVHFENFPDLKIEWIRLSEEKINWFTFFEFYAIAKKVKPDIIHTWGSLHTLITLPFLLSVKKTKLVNSQITSAPPKLSFSESLICKINFLFSDVILSNSFAGIESYNPPKSKSKVIYNGLNFKRFENLIPVNEIKANYGLDKKFTIIMVASYAPNKDYVKFFKIGIALSKLRNDFQFIGLGYFKGGGEKLYEECLKLTESYPNLVPVPGSSDVESLVNACDLGMLFSPFGEGLSNAILEYMALGKPSIANDAGGNKEIIKHGQNGYLVKEESEDEIALIMHRLLNNPDLVKTMGLRCKEFIYSEFSLERMGKEFEEVYESSLK
jgi:glycosyltransferase involved in cell wall biosynthesis